MNLNFKPSNLKIRLSELIIHNKNSNLNKFKYNDNNTPKFFKKIN